MSNIDHPDHYNYGSIEVIDYIEDKDLNFNNLVEFNSGVKKYLFYDDGQMDFE